MSASPLLRPVALASLFCLGLTACERPNPRVPEGMENNNQQEVSNVGKDKFSLMEKAQAEIAPTEGNNVSGLVTFKPDAGGQRMQVSVDLEGLSPGKHGFHIHTHPNCDNQAKAAGGHFNPQEVEHGGPEDNTQHAGDLGNIVANAQGEVQTTIKTDQLSFSGPNNIVNRAVVVHANNDDLKSQPSGDAGPRVACGIIRPQKDELVHNQ